MAGKVKEYVLEHHLAIHTFGSNFNGYGYSTQHYWYLLKAKDAKVVQEMIAGSLAKAHKTPSPEEKKAAWCRRLAKLTGIDTEIAESIADEKLEDQERKIEELEERQWSMGYSVKREKLIDKIRRSNPLRRIKDQLIDFQVTCKKQRHVIPSNLPAKLHFEIPPHTRCEQDLPS